MHIADVIRSSHAFQLSIQRFFAGRLQSYLWTFTASEPGTDLKWHRQRMRLFADWCRKVRQLEAIYVYEPHPGGHGIHVHLVTWQRWDVDEIRKETTRLGWGRINVCRPRDPKYAFYIGKYLRKSWKTDSGDRGSKWGAIGFKTTRICDVRFSRNVLTLEKHVHKAPIDGQIWHVPTFGRFTYFKPGGRVGGPLLSTMSKISLKPVQTTEILASVLRGDLILVAEYRSGGAETLKFKDQRTQQPIERVLVKHNVEVGEGRPLTLTEWMPQGTDAKDVKKVHSVGDLVILRIDSARMMKGRMELSGHVQPMTQLV